MKQILLDNACEAWETAIKYCDLLLVGKSTLLNKKFFVSSLHNAVELFLKQCMLNNNDHQVAEIRKIKNLNTAKLLVSYYESNDLNTFFYKLNYDEIAEFWTTEFCNLKFSYNGKNYTSDLKLLKDLRNNETHFYISEYSFLTDKEFIQLYNFMVDFYKYLKENKLLAFLDTPYGEYEKFIFERKKIENFSYAEALYHNPLSQKILNILDESEEYGDVESSFDLAKAIFKKNKDILSNNFDDVWITLDIMIKCGILEAEDISEDGSWYFKYHVLKD